MPSGLIIKRPKTGPALAQLVIGALTAGPLLGLWYLWDHHLDVHFDHPWVNLGAHAALIVIPLIWAALISFTPVKFEPTEEIILGKTSFLDKFPFDWWTMLMLWPAAVVGTMAIGVALFTECLPHPEELSTSPLKALAIMVVTFCLGVFYGTMLLGNDEPRTLVSQAGLRTGMLRFFEWENIHHLSQRGDVCSIYHYINPRLPAASFKLHSPKARATLERFLSEHRVQVFNGSDPAFAGIRLGVVAGFLVNLLFALWLRLNSSLSILWIIVICFVVGVLLTLLLERMRGVSKHTKYKPVIEPETETRPHPEI